jgi:hypothetical protein
MNHQLAATPVPANGIANTERVSGHDFSKYFIPFFIFSRHAGHDAQSRRDL